ncbi:MAG TPA: hypothetical protein VFT59_00100 [Candidatus Saccharimonadales bacterium]|nr:hypothetical protein [Candidatus Saccharimonadales bacterium]
MTVFLPAAGAAFAAFCAWWLELSDEWWVLLIIFGLMFFVFYVIIKTVEKSSIGSNGDRELVEDGAPDAKGEKEDGDI